MITNESVYKLFLIPDLKSYKILEDIKILIKTKLILYL